MFQVMKSIFLLGFVLTTQVVYADVHQDFKKTLTVVKDAYSERYGLMQYKKQKFGWNVERQYRGLLQKGLSNPDLTVDQAQALVVELVRSTRDYHGRAVLGAKPHLKLGIWVRSIAGHVFVAYLDSDYRGKAKVGDELLTFDGVPGYQALLNVSERKYPNLVDADQRNAERILTERYGSLSDPIPTRLQAKLSFRRGKQAFDETFDWKEVSSVARASLAVDRNPVPESLRGNMEGNPHGYSQRVSYLPQLGQIVWEEQDHGSPFYSWISKLSNGKKVGMIRVPTFALDSAEAYTQAVQAFALLIEKMKAETDVLILDIQANRGGMLDYGYALASFFFNTNIEAFRFQYRIFSDVVSDASQLYSGLEKIGTLDEAYDFFGGKDYFGFPIDLDFVSDMKEFTLGILSDAQAHLPFGKARYYNTSRIKPFAGTRYLKPLILAIDGWTGSTGDTFAALLQDNCRATIVGARSAGAGAFVGNSFQLENPLGFTSFVMPIALAYRYRNAVIENVGVEPDIRVDFTIDDLKGGKLDHYRREFEKIVLKLSNSSRFENQIHHSNKIVW